MNGVYRYLPALIDLIDDPAVDWCVVARLLAGQDPGRRSPTWAERVAAVRAMPSGSTVTEVQVVCRCNHTYAARLLNDAHNPSRLEAVA